MNYDKIKRTGILFLLGIGAITSLSCNDNDNANYPERVPTRLSVMPLRNFLFPSVMPPTIVPLSV